MRGLHGTILANAFKKIPFLCRRAGKYTLWAAALLFAAWGALGFIRLRLWDKLFFEFSFGFWDGSAAGFLAASAGIFWLFAAGTYLMMQRGESK